jgi:hypothetical protein
LVFTEENYTEIRQYIAASLPDNRRSAGLKFLDSCAKTMRRTLNKSEGVDRVLLAFYSKFFVAGQSASVFLWFRELGSKLSNWFFGLLLNSKAEWLQNFARWRLGQLKDSYYTLDGGWKPNGIVGMFEQFGGWFTAQFPKTSVWLWSVFRWMFPVLARILS